MEEKPRYYNQARNKASQKYAKENLEQIAIRVKKGERAALKVEADKQGRAWHNISLVPLTTKRASRCLPHQKRC